jgi:hypothetical protein
MIVGNGSIVFPAAPFERYDPTLDIWTAASTVNAPTGGAYGVGPPVWTGQYVISMGKRYDPNADLWSAISLVNAPESTAPVNQMVALWTGSEMILWRPGYGGRYNPATDSWTPISNSNGPSASYDGYEGVWSGSRMIIWGGYDSINQITVGGQYDLATDTWSSISTVNEPSRRRGFGTVWAGGRMVVWGGFDFTCAQGGCSWTEEYPSSGGSYNPITDVWTTFSGIGGREKVSAVSTGAEAIFWGGAGCLTSDCSITGDSSQDGFRFDPQTGAVTPLATLNAPSPRVGSAAVWTGDEMLVWGGLSNLASSGISRLDGGRWSIPPSPDADGDGFDASCDCDESRASVYPGAPQICDGRNNDCSDPGWPALSGTNEGDGDGDGYAVCSGDCDDLDPATHRGAAEVNDGKDNQCPGEPGFGIVDEVDDLWFPDASNTARICWLPQPAAGSYRLALSGEPFRGEDAYCGTPVTSPCNDSALLPAPGNVFFYLVRVEAPLAGDWGQRSSGSGTSVTCGAGSSPQEFSFVDHLLVDDVPADALRSFFSSMPSPSPSDYVLIQLESSPGFTERLCAQRADFYRDSYLSLGVGGGVRMSGSWKKWYQSGGGAWAGPITDGLQNFYGSACSAPYSWCAEWGLGSIYLWTDPAATTECEVSNDSAGCGAGGRLTIRIGSNRVLTCGF